MCDLPQFKSVIHLYFPFKVHHTSVFRMKTVMDRHWETDKNLSTGFYLKYIDRIFNKNGIYSDCLVVKNTAPDCDFIISGIPLSASSARIFFFDTSVAFLELNFPFSCNDMGELETLTSKLRLSNQKIVSMPNGSAGCLNNIACDMLSDFGKFTMFEHLGDNGETRPELFVSVVSETDIEDIDMHAYRIANGFDTRYKKAPDDGRFYSNFSYIRWAVTKRGVCNIGIKTDNEENRNFIEKNWHLFTETRYIIWYILVLHQKYSMYQYMNDIADKSSLGNLREFQKKIMIFNTKYRFSIIAEETSYQKLYEIMSDVKGLENEFNDIDDEIERISEFYESKNDRNANRAMTIISILCAVSAIKDFYEIIPKQNMLQSFVHTFNSLSHSTQLIFSVFIFLIAISMLIVLPKTAIIQNVKKYFRALIRFLFKNITK